MPVKTQPGLEMFAAKGADEIYTAIISALQNRVGAANAFVDPKQTCVHINAGKDGTAYVGIHPRKSAVMLTIRTQKPIKSKRIRKAEQVSANRCHCDTIVASLAEVDEELLGWLQHASGLLTQSKPSKSK